MSTMPAKQPPDTPAETVEQRFRRLEAIWDEEIGYSSSPIEICNHWAFQEILQMGEAVVPLMLGDLEKEPTLWVWALPRITGANPVPLSEGGNITKMSMFWLRWGEEHGYQWQRA